MGSEPGIYADSLLKACRFCVESPLTCVAGVTGDDLKKRIVRIMARHVGLHMSLGRKLFLGAVALAAIAAPVVLGLAQTATDAPDWQKAAGSKMEFDVASIRQNKDDNPRQNSNFPLDSGDRYEPLGGLFRATGLPAIVYINFAYKLGGNKVESLAMHLPAWTLTDKFDIEAHAGGKPTKDQMRLMMQALLKERFGFAMHYETRESPVFALEVAKPGKLGPQLRQHPANAACINQLPLNAAGYIAPPPGPRTDAEGFPTLCGGITFMPPKTPGTSDIGARDITMKLFADGIGGIGQLGRPVLDRTGLTGTYDFWMEFTPQNDNPAPPEANPPPLNDAGSSFIEALKEQLGLRLESQEGQVEEIVVDHIDRPTAN
jgi:bla regulator protein BlaR1